MRRFNPAFEAGDVLQRALFMQQSERKGKRSPFCTHVLNAYRDWLAYKMPSPNKQAQVAQVIKDAGFATE